MTRRTSMGESKRARQHDGNPVLAAPCPECGKRCYLTRKAAKAAMRRFSRGEANVSVYRCGDYFHFGHQPYSVRRGFEDRNTWRRSQ